MIKKIIFFSFFFFISVLAQSKNNEDFVEKFIIKFKTINNIKFDFIQTNDRLVETGNCFISYPKKLICRYAGNDRKEVVIKKNTLAIIKRKYHRVYYYRVTNSPFTTILDKNKIIEQIKNIKNISAKDNLLIIKFNNPKDNSSLRLFVNKDTLDIAGWKTTGYDQQSISFSIKNSEINVDIKEKFEIPNFDLNRNGN
jgi:outer membrane lipoprotein-sorting protein